MADYTLEQQAEMKNSAYKKLRKMGLKDINQNTLSKYITYADNEKAAREKEDPITTLNNSQQERHKDISKKFP